MIKRIKINNDQKGFVFIENEFRGILESGQYIRIDPLNRLRVDIVSVRNPWVEHKDLEVIVKSGKLDNMARIIDLNDSRRALVWIDKRFSRALGPGLYALWTEFCEVDVEIRTTENVMLEHKEEEAIASSERIGDVLNIVTVEEGYAGVFFKNGRFENLFEPGKYMFWKNTGKVRFYHVDIEVMN